MNAITVLLAVGGAFVLRQLATIFYNVFLSPLRAIPGPWWAPITAFPTTYACQVQQRNSRFCHALHQKYGPIVRMAPNEILIADLTAYKEVYRMGTRFLKTRLYNFLNPGPPGEPPFGLFQETDPVLHGQRRKLFARSFTLSSLRANWESTIRGHIEELVRRMRIAAEKSGGEIDIYLWWPRLTGDVISTLSFGKPLGMIENERVDDIMKAMANNSAGGGLAYTFPWAYPVLKHLPIKRLQEMFGGNKLLLSHGKAAIEYSKHNPDAPTIFTKILEEAEKDDARRTLTDMQIIIEAGVFLFGGTDTTAVFLTYLVWVILSDPNMQAQLEDEVSQLRESFSDEDVEALPITNAVINETFRLYTPAPAAMPRYTPPEGANLGGYFIPGGTTVATQSYTLHRDPAIFEKPERFDHTRWLGDFASREDVKTAFSPFGAGSRICIGNHLAMMEIRLAIALFFRAFKGAKLAPSTTPESMDIENIFIIAPKGHTCRVVLPV